MARKSKVLSREEDEGDSNDSERLVGKEQQYRDQSATTEATLDSDASDSDTSTMVSKVGTKSSHTVMKPRRKVHIARVSSVMQGVSVMLVQAQ